MDETELSTLESLALGATAGPWRQIVEYDGPLPAVETTSGSIVASCVGGAADDAQQDSDARYIAALSPEVTLSLIASARGLAGLPKVVDDFLSDRLEQCFCTQPYETDSEICEACMEVARVRGALASLFSMENK